MAKYPKYPTHIPLNPLFKGAVATLSAAGALLRPARADLVAAVGETTGEWQLQRLKERMLADPTGTGRVILEEKPRIKDEFLAQCWNLPPHTFGGAYAQFMKQRHFHADDRPPVRFVDDAELAYVICRMREVHDLWHVLFGCHTNVFGELALKALEFVQTGMPMTGLAVAGAQFRLKPQERVVLQQQFLPWALRAGNNCHDLMTIYYERHIEEDLDDLRRQWRIIPAPAAPKPTPKASGPSAQEGPSAPAPST
ncbi:ubiquinone biosynthesis protein [Dunaliella salina]|uniref:Ubiquinone biosynthesis protein COQ4 homolog, mitochondrial n=1 Tax=Dunaliella salina TaxID=3046 RepID=A0ABQ7GTM8_DUNSA|nr:ubiquinone biosynthesis protein [Dunaliella salina]|eukprot:KAF5837961.1 ubiquinone biosynthesis protein [Dunaliella salina]